MGNFASKYLRPFSLFVRVLLPAFIRIRRLLYTGVCCGCNCNANVVLHVWGIHIEETRAQYSCSHSQEKYRRLRYSQYPLRLVPQRPIHVVRLFLPPGWTAAQRRPCTHRPPNLSVPPRIRHGWYIVIDSGTIGSKGQQVKTVLHHSGADGGRALLGFAT